MRLSVRGMGLSRPYNTQPPASYPNYFPAVVSEDALRYDLPAGTLHGVTTPLWVRTQFPHPLGNLVEKRERKEALKGIVM